MRRHRQEEVFRAMSRPDFYPHAVTRIEVRDTHISKVFLTGDWVYKIKKAVNFDFLDFTTLSKRRDFCRREIELNRRLTSDVYLDVVPITGHQNRLRLGGTGEPVEYAVKMRQLPEDFSLLKLLRQKRFDLIKIEALGQKLAGFYAATPVPTGIARYGSVHAIRCNCDENFRQLTDLAADYLDERQFRITRAATRAFLSRQTGLFVDRIDENRIRDCHGDLRCGHIYFEKDIAVIDCIEFNDRFRYGDVAADLAFLVMDLEYEGFPEMAGRLIDAYVHASGDVGIYVLLDFYKCYRAMVKSKICCFALQQMPEDNYFRKKLQREARRHLSMAYRYAIRFTRPTLWVICGLPASGKSTVAERLGHTLHIEVLASDRIRKHLFGLESEDAVDVDFEEGIYSPGNTALTYGRLLIAAQETLEHGRSVIIDATFGSEHHRREALQLARDKDANILFVECVASTRRIKERLKAREKKGSVSDARLHHLEDLLNRFEPLSDIQDEHHLRIDTEASLDESIETILGHDYYWVSTPDLRQV